MKIIRKQESTTETQRLDIIAHRGNFERLGDKCNDTRAQLRESNDELCFGNQGLRTETLPFSTSDR